MPRVDRAMPKHRSATPLHAAAPAGFTLIEVMVVVTILGLLATLVVQNVVHHAEEARLQKARSDVVTIASAAKLFHAQRGRLPTLAELTTPDAKGDTALEGLLRDPWHHEYRLIPGENQRDHEVRSDGPDGQPGSDDDISSRPPSS